VTSICWSFIHRSRASESPPRSTPELGSQIADALGSFAVASETANAAPQWESQLDALRDAVERWTGTVEARQRLKYANAYLEIAELVLEDERSEMPGVAAGPSVLAGIAASDAICALRRGEIHRGESHREASDLLRGATPDGKRLASTLLKLLDIKDEAHYGLIVVPLRKAKDAVRWAGPLMARANEELGR
jgi:hypothetical protein